VHSPQAGSSLPARSRLAGYKVYNTAKWVSIMLVVRREGEDEGGGGGGRGEDEGEDEGRTRGKTRGEGERPVIRKRL